MKLLGAGGAFPSLATDSWSYVGLSHLQTHGVSRQVLVPPGVSPIGDRPGQGGSDILYSAFCILYSVFCILYSVFCVVCYPGSWVGVLAIAH